MHVRWVHSYVSTAERLDMSMGGSLAADHPGDYGVSMVSGLHCCPIWVVQEGGDCGGWVKWLGHWLGGE